MNKLDFWQDASTNIIITFVPSIAVAHIQSRVRLWGICGAQSGSGAGFLQVLWFPLPMLIPPTAP
jgi:hypothetical protein